jgi:hypothetical protein
MHFDAQKIASLQADLTAAWHDQPPCAAGEGFKRLTSENHLRNFLLWHEEDIARRDDLGFERVYQAKRAIDRYNQERNNFIEEMDQALAAALRPPADGCAQNSETPGMIIDRLSILSLKEFHMREQAMREDAAAAHRALCSAKLSRIVLQREDLTRSLAELIAAVVAGTRTFALYYQFKMYNDPSLNPQLYRSSGTPDA